ncbi:pyrroline-5-carboxylate reductase family protein [Aspergillus saccharolyticus JOP 1030-1]|uniref:Pyrroline-5-carboxylate reductase n=1 Tax=Aspergillus saccharolyticus JOP 1030-1 TaxID=1450539 RepID=A0A319ABD7_9EURO|nr:pyrroline-5-carboxylate reductase [Aspergillus saccharolyticus JOP 1030-1]PYH48958.1 pyrroline-5-carboxylate reductase [Aspergillus saccharolyticus JOP 1030-1]
MSTFDASSEQSLSIIGCGNMGTAILNGLLQAQAAPAQSDSTATPLPKSFIATVRSTTSHAKLTKRFAPYLSSSSNNTSQCPQVTILQGPTANSEAIRNSTTILLCIDPADISSFFADVSIRAALRGKFVISIAAGWTRDALFGSLSPEIQDLQIVRALPNMAASVGQSITAIEVPPPPKRGLDGTGVDAIPNPTDSHIAFVQAIFSAIGRTLLIPPSQMTAFTAVGGSTPAFVAVFADALIEGAVAMGFPRADAQTTIFQALRGATALMQDGGLHPAMLRDQGTSPGGCTMGGLMVLEERGLRGTVARGMREAVSVAGLMGKQNEDEEGFVNGTR